MGKGRTRTYKDLTRGGQEQNKKRTSEVQDTDKDRTRNRIRNRTRNRTRIGL